MITIVQATESLRMACRTTNYSPCTTRMAGYLHGLLKELSGVPKRYQYAVMEVVFGCEIYTFSQLTFHTCKTLIDAFQSNPDVPALFHEIYKAVEAKVGEETPMLPGDFKDFLMVCGEGQVYAF